ncbi:alcohol dehydrogenase zinc-binding domain protein [Colletotrichum kahawae]|uniref:Alcohol dehydrogenase zinc-binding domain protein n=1 Tax=Colletotrichum kahawae TaxID=34407 RepID=A0AAD9YK53_COLKA|nr:alcohol dehydrogenase zinc-binding domain protein [Colletotrichum kahawae]
MKAIQILGPPSSPKITTTTSLPVPNTSEILIRVHAAGITADELLWPELYASKTRIPGHEISGTIAALGPTPTGPPHLNQEVFAFIAADRGGGGQAEYVVCLPHEVAPKPASLSHEEAAALPIPLLTAWEAVITRGDGGPGMKVRVTGAGGAVGRIAVQLAARRGAEVVALASSRSSEKLRGLRAREVLDYEDEGWSAKIRGVDLVFDTVGGDVLGKTWEVVRPGGMIITVGDPAPGWAFGSGPAEEAVRYPDVRYKYFIVSPNLEALSEAAGMIDAGLIEVLRVEAFSFEEAEQAWEYAGKRGRDGKAVITFGDFAEHDRVKE